MKCLHITRTTRASGVQSFSASVWLASQYLEVVTLYSLVDETQVFDDAQRLEHQRVGLFDRTAPAAVSAEYEPSAFATVLTEYVRDVLAVLTRLAVKRTHVSDDCRPGLRKTVRVSKRTVGCPTVGKRMTRLRNGFICALARSLSQNMIAVGADSTEVRH